MLTIYVSPHDQQITTADGQVMTVKGVFIREAGGFVSLYDFKPSTDLNDVRIVLVRKYLKNKILQLPTELTQAMIHFFCEYHAKINMEFDCYAFANLVKGVEVHKVPYMLKYWDKHPLSWRIAIGSVVFFRSGKNRFHHAAIYIGSDLYISVYGAGGDLEVATLKTMKRDYGAEKAVLAQPK